MLTVIATLKAKTGSEAALEKAAQEMVEYVKQHEPGTITYLVNRCASDPTEYVFYEVYADQAAFAAHGGSEQMQKFFGVAASLLDGRPAIKMYEEVGGKK